MHIVKNLKNLHSLSQNTAVAIGNFDGIHLGHQKILQALVQEAKTRSLLPIVLTFDPHPEKLLRGKKIRMLQTLEQRLEEIEKFKISHTVVQIFDKSFARLPAEEFIKNIVCHKLRAKAVIVGENFRFGRNKEGNTAKLHQYAEKFHFFVLSILPVVKQGKAVSSSLIRDLLQKGQIEMANKLIGRPYSIEGQVIRGKSRGKNMGFPTANIRTRNDIAPPGVFISQVRIHSKIWPSVTHVGRKPTFNDTDWNIESYIMKFKNNLYGEKIQVQFLKKIRDEKKFDSPKKLSLQIQQDIAAAQNFFHKSF
jgi:riboflavin kinase/FMN adenylyltransferase